MKSKILILFLILFLISFIDSAEAPTSNKCDDAVRLADAGAEKNIPDYSKVPKSDFADIAQSIVKNPKEAKYIAGGGFGDYYIKKIGDKIYGVKIQLVRPKMVYDESKVARDLKGITPEFFEVGTLIDKGVTKGYIVREYVDGFTLRGLTKNKGKIPKNIQKLLKDLETELAEKGYAVDYTVDNIVYGTIGDAPPKVYLIDLGGAKQVCKPVTEKCIKELKAQYKYTREKLFPTDAPYLCPTTYKIR